MATPTKRKRRLVWKIVVHRGKEAALPPVTPIATHDLQKFLTKLVCFLAFDEQTSLYHQGYQMIAGESENILKDLRFRDYEWHIPKYEIVLIDELRVKAKKAAIVIKTILISR